jgi:hypothetical protein
MDKSEEERTFYKGYFKANKFDGQGEYDSPWINYRGQFAEGLFHGEGDRVDLDPNVRFPIYSGEFSKSIFNGKGTLMSEDKSTLLKGSFVDGLLNGIVIEKKFDPETEEEKSEIFYLYKGGQRVRQLVEKDEELDIFITAQREMVLT